MAMDPSSTTLEDIELQETNNTTKETAIISSSTSTAKHSSTANVVPATSLTSNNSAAIEVATTSNKKIQFLQRLFWWYGLPCEVWFSLLHWAAFVRFKREVYYWNLSATGLAPELLYALFIFVPSYLLIQPLVKQIYSRIHLVFRFLLVLFVGLSAIENISTRTIFTGLAMVSGVTLQEAMIYHPVKEYRRRFMVSNALGVLLLMVVRFADGTMNPLWHRVSYNMVGLIIGVVGLTMMTVEQVYILVTKTSAEAILNKGSTKVVNQSRSVTATVTQPKKMSPQAIGKMVLVSLLSILCMIAFAFTMSGFLTFMTHFYVQSTVIPRWAGLSGYPYGISVMLALVLGIFLQHSKLLQSVLLYLLTVAAGLTFFFADGFWCLIGGLFMVMFMPSWLRLIYEEMYHLDAAGVYFLATLIDVVNFFCSIGSKAKGNLPLFGALFGGTSGSRTLWTIILLLHVTVFLSSMLHGVIRLIKDDRLNVLKRHWHLVVFTSVIMPRYYQQFVDLSQNEKAPQSTSPSKLGAVKLLSWRTPHVTVLATLFVLGIGIAAAITIRTLQMQTVSNSNYRQFKVMSYNIFQGHSLYGMENADMLVDVIKQSGAQIIGFQESDSVYPTSDSIDVIEYVAQSLHMRYFHGFASNQATFGCAVISSYPILSTAVVQMPCEQCDITLQRPLCYVKVLLGDTPIHFFNGHVEGYETVQFRYIVNHINQTVTSDGDGQHVVLVGDFNTQPHTKEYNVLYNATLVDAYAVTHQGNHNITYSSKFMTDVIDYIWFKNMNVTNADIFQSTASDHWAVYATFTLP